MPRQDWVRKAVNPERISKEKGEMDYRRNNVSYIVSHKRDDSFLVMIYDFIARMCHCNVDRY